jgi:UPF0755 protein
MQPEPLKDNKPKPSLDGVRRPTGQSAGQRKPDYRPDHELPAPDPVPLLAEHKETMPVSEASPQPSVFPDVSLPSQSDQKSAHTFSRRKKWIFGIIAATIIALVVAVSACFIWYQQHLSPVSTDTTKHIRVIIAPGTTPDAIGKILQKDGVIRDSLAFTIYTKLSGTENNLKAGAYSLQPSLSTPAIVDHLVAGKQDTYQVTFLPGDTLANNRQKLIDVGFTAAEVDAALSKTYDLPLFANKPAGNDLEGYLYGETLEFDSSATASSILERFFDQYQDFVVENKIVDGFKKQGLNLFQGITLASIVQREVATKDDMAQVARVFLNRLEAGMTLGSDVTYQYAAKKLGVAPNPLLDSPYNTRKYPGLPPGPIATPGNSAMLAIANPGTNDYLFFLSGDDNVTYFAKTDAQHQQNITNHCQKKCLIN